MASEIHVGDVGTKLIFTIQDGSNPVDLSGYSSIVLIFVKPDKTELSKAVQFETDGTDGVVYYVSQSGDFSVAGQYKLQAVASTGSSVFSSSVVIIPVSCNIY